MLQLKLNMEEFNMTDYSYTYNIEMPSSEVGNIKRIVSKFNRADKVCTGDNIITGLSDIVLNHVSVDGNALSCSNHITVGFSRVKPCTNAETGEKIGVSIDFETKTAQAVNYDNFTQLSFIKNKTLYKFTFTHK